MYKHLELSESTQEMVNKIREAMQRKPDLSDLKNLSDNSTEDLSSRELIEEGLKQGKLKNTGIDLQEVADRMKELRELRQSREVK